MRESFETVRIEVPLEQNFALSRGNARARTFDALHSIGKRRNGKEVEFCGEEESREVSELRNFYHQLLLLMRSADENEEDTQIFKNIGSNEIFSEISEQESRRILMDSKVRGDDFSGNKMAAFDLKLIHPDLRPLFQVEMNGGNINFSRPFANSDSRIFYVGYVESGPAIIPRIFYRSNSHGLYRGMLGYGVNKKGELSWFGKGLNECSVTLTHNLQRVLNSLSVKYPPFKVEFSEMVFRGLSKKKTLPGNRPYTLEDASISGLVPSGLGERIEGDFYAIEIEQLRRKYENLFSAVHENVDSPNALKENIYIPCSSYNELLPPESLEFHSPDQYPNFDEVVDIFQISSSLYGTITVEVIPSWDQNIHYMFCRDKLNRVWIGGAEFTNSELTTRGLISPWIDLGCLDTPAFDYPHGFNKYENKSVKKGNYVDMFDKYLRHVPVIQMYYQVRGIPMPTSEDLQKNFDPFGTQQVESVN